MKKKVTIQDIADALGISRNTVSKAINNSEGLAESTRERILQKSMEMGYKQFSYVQSFVRQTDTENEQSSREEEPLKEIALLSTMHFIGSHFASITLDHLHRELLQLGYRLITYHVTADDLTARALPFGFEPAKVSAIVCIEMFHWDYDMMLCKLGRPILFIDGPAQCDGRSLPADQLYMESFTALHRLLCGIIQQGVTRIGFIGDQEHCQSFYERYLAVCCALLMGGHSVEPKFMIQTLSGLDICSRLSELDEMPELFVCANDFVAYDALVALRKLGKSVPEDVMLCGFDDAPESRMVVPPFTTVHIHTQTIAYTAAQLLISRIDAPSLDYRKVYTETDLICRESTRYLPFGDKKL